MEKVVFLDRATVRTSVRRPAFAHEWIDFDNTAPEEMPTRLADATIAITNKVKIGREAIECAPKLRLVAVAATGFNCVDTEACQERGIAVANVPSYSRDSVPEHVLLLMLALRRQLLLLDQAVREGAWQKAPFFAILDYPIEDLAGTTLGIVGHGDLGRRVERLAGALGMQVLISDHKGAATVRAGRVAFETVLERSDVITLHCPLTESTRGLIGAPELARMKRSAILINTARGGLVDEAALASALIEKKIGGAGFDVLSEEPPRRGNPLLNPSIPNLLVTPHVGWASRQSQERLVEEVILNLESFVQGKPRNIVV